MDSRHAGASVIVWNAHVSAELIRVAMSFSHVGAVLHFPVILTTDVCDHRQCDQTTVHRP